MLNISILRVFRHYGIRGGGGGRWASFRTCFGVTFIPEYFGGHFENQLLKAAQ